MHCSGSPTTPRAETDALVSEQGIKNRAAVSRAVLATLTATDKARANKDNVEMVTDQILRSGRPDAIRDYVKSQRTLLDRKMANINGAVTPGARQLYSERSGLSTAPRRAPTAVKEAGE